MPADLPPATVETVVVTAPRLPPSPADAAFSVIGLSQETLEGSRRLDEALISVPGASLFRRTTSTGANPTIQGISLRAIGPTGAGRALVTLDGVPQNDPFGGWVIWTSLPPEAAENVQIVRGAGAGPYGAGALTGVVAIDEKSRIPGGWLADVSAAERDGWRGAAAASADVGIGTVTLVAAGERSDGWTPVRAGRGAADIPTNMTGWNAAAKFVGEAAGATVAARVSAYDETRGAGLVGADSRARGWQASATAVGQPSPYGGALGWRVQGWVKQSDLMNRSVAVAAGRGSTTPANEQYRTPATGVGLNAALRSSDERLTWELGVDARYAEGKDQERFRFIGGAFTRDRVAGGETSVIGAYAEAALVADKWLVTGGVRLDRWSSSDALRLERDLATGVATLNDHSPDRDGTTPTGRVGLRYNLTDGLYMRAAGYAGFRPPTLNELHRPFRVGNDITEANAGLKPERLIGAEVALGGSGGPLNWQVTGFWTRLDDPITNVTIGIGPGTFPRAGLVPAGGVLRERRNAGQIEATGVEAEANGRLGDATDWRAALAYTDAEVDGGSAAPQLTGKRPAQSPKLTVTAGAGWRPIERLSLDADLRYESARFEDDLNLRRLSAGISVDAKASWRLSPMAEIYVAAENLTDEAIETGETADGIESFSAPRTFRIGLRIAGRSE